MLLEIGHFTKIKAFLARRDYAYSQGQLGHKENLKDASLGRRKKQRQEGISQFQFACAAISFKHIKFLIIT